MMGFDVRLTPEANRFLVQMAKESPKEVRRALGLAASIVRSRMRSMMRGKKSPLAPWKELTRKIRATSSAAWANMFGGQLVYPKYKQLAIVPSGDHCRVGWIGPLEHAALLFQEGGAVTLPKAFRRSLYRTGNFVAHEIPATDNQQPREVVDPVAAESRSEFAHWVAGCFKRVIEGSIKSAERGMVRATSTSARIRYANQAARGYAHIAHGDVQELLRRGVL